MKKPLMEKKRRARMNECLDRLKQLMLQISPNQRNKLEKAHILEMTVEYLNALSKSGLPTASAEPENSSVYWQSYAQGFIIATTACLAYISSQQIGQQVPNLYSGLLEHLDSILRGHMQNHGDTNPVTQFLAERSAMSLWRNFVNGQVSLSNRTGPAVPFFSNASSHFEHPQFVPFYQTPGIGPPASINGVAYQSLGNNIVNPAILGCPATITVPVLIPPPPPLLRPPTRSSTSSPSRTVSASSTQHFRHAAFSRESSESEVWRPF